MDYVYYVLVILGILALCLSFIRFPGRLPGRNRQVDLPARTPSRSELAKQDQNSRAVLQRERMKVPTPWGWPGSEYGKSLGRHASLHAEEIHGVSDSLHRWVDQMVSAKQTVHDEEYRLKREASMRALLEDRYGRSVGPRPMKYQKTRPPLLRNPSEPHDQMDNFPSGKLNGIENKLKQNAPPVTRANSDPGRSKKVRFEELKEIRTPWGW